MSAFAYLLPLLVWVGLLVACILSVYVAWRALFADRGNNRRRCPKCWYDLAYSPGMTCAECGYVARHERELQRTRRRPFVAFAAILICVALVLGVNDQLSQRGYLRHIPTRALIWTLPITGGMDGAAGKEIDRRAASRQLTPEHWAALIDRCAEGDWFSEPPADNWIANYGNFIENWRNHFINDVQLETPLKDIPPRLDVRTREVWPEGVPVVVGVRLDDWWPAGMECRVRATPRVEGAEGAAPITFYRSGEIRFRPSPFSMYLPPLKAGNQEIRIDFQIDRRRMESVRGRRIGLNESNVAEGDVDPGTPWEPVGTYSIAVKTRVEGSLAEMMKPLASESLDSLVLQVFGTAVKWSGGRSPVRFGINAQPTAAAEFDDTSIGVSVELEHNGVVARRLNLWWVAGTKIADRNRNYGFEVNFENLELLKQLTSGAEGWLLRVRSDPLIALRAGVTKQHWQGEVTMPVNLRANQTDAPPRMWWTDEEQSE